MSCGKRTTRIVSAAAVFAAAAASAQEGAERAVSAQEGAERAAENTLDLGTTSITGNRELPKVLYIVPWKTSDLGEIVGRPVNTLLDEVLAPIDPEVFERQLRYYAVLEAPPAAPPADAPEAGDAKTQED